MSSAGIFSNQDAGRFDLPGRSHLNPPPKLVPEVTSNASPVFTGDFGESNSQSSRGSVNKSGGQSISLAPLASFSFFSRAGVALYVRLVLGAGIATIERCPFPSRM